MAAADAQRQIKNAAYRLFCTIRNGSDDVITSLNGLSAILAKDSASTSATTNMPVEIGTSGIVYLDLTATEMAFNYSGTVLVTATNGQATDAEIHLQGEPGLDSGVCQAGSTSTTAVLRASASSTDDLYNGAQIEIVRGTGAGQVRTATDYVGSSKTLTVERAWATTPDTTSVYLIHPVVGSKHAAAGVPDVNVTQLKGETPALDVLVELYQGSTLASVDDAGPSTTDFTGSSALTATADFYNKSFVLFTSGALKGLMRPINDYTAARNLSFAASDAWPSAPANGDEFVVISYNA